MQMTQLVSKLGRNDARLIRRDSFLIFMFGFVVVLAFVLRIGIPALTDYLAENNVLNEGTFITSLSALYPMFVTYMGIYTGGGVLVGTVFGFMLLDERDDNTIKAMLVTPVPLSHYALYRVGLPTFIAAFVIIIEVLFINQALLPAWQLVLIAISGSLAAPTIALFYATFAGNKVQGFAYSKFVSIAGWILMGGWFVPEPFQWLLGFFPPFWTSKAYWMAYEGNNLWIVVWLISIVTQVGLIYWLVQRFVKVVYR